MSHIAVSFHDQAVSIAYNTSMPRFTLKQLLAGVLFACVYLAVLRDVFAEVTHAAVALARGGRDNVSMSSITQSSIPRAMR